MDVKELVYGTFIEEVKNRFLCKVKIQDEIYSFHEKRHETLAEYYYRTNRHLLGKIKVAEFDPDKNILRIIQA